MPWMIYYHKRWNLSLLIISRCCPIIFLWLLCERNTFFFQVILILSFLSLTANQLQPLQEGYWKNKTQGTMLQTKHVYTGIGYGTGQPLLVYPDLWDPSSLGFPTNLPSLTWVSTWIDFLCLPISKAENPFKSSVYVTFPIKSFLFFIS